LLHSVEFPRIDRFIYGSLGTLKINVGDNQVGEGFATGGD
jgi:hypothetical protein